MRLHLISLFLLGALGLVQGAAAAADPFDYHCADVTILQFKEVQKEIGITEAQRKKMNDAAEVHRTRLTTYDQQQKAAKTKDSPDQQRTKLKSFYDELKKGVLTQLSAGQLKRLRELTLQRAGLTAILDKVVAKRVGFTDAQFENYRKTFAAGANQAGTLERNTLKPIFDKYRAMNPKTDAEKKSLEGQMRGELDAASKKIAPQMQKIQSDTQKKLEAIFNPGLKAKWTALLGKPFKPK